MTVQRFDMSGSLSPSRTRDIVAISKLWNQIPTDVGFALNDPQDTETLRLLMMGLDYFVKRNNQLQVIGAASVMLCSPQLAKIDSLAVDPKYHLRGYGKQLAKSAVNYCASIGCEEIVTFAVPASQPIFTSLGFEVFERHSSTGNATMFCDLT